MKNPQINLADKIERQLPDELTSFIKSAGRLADSRGESLYLVGGPVRDLLLGKTSLDLDLVVTGDAAALALELLPDRLTVHKRFNTAKLKWRGWSIDLTSARSESYARPGSLPQVRPGRLSDDLLRRDFAINAMAITLNPNGYGELIDPCGGMADLEQGLVRILHEKGFIDDATRIWRGIRYEQRLGFKLEAGTLRLLKRDIAMLDTISGDRIRCELEYALNEEYPEKVFGRAYELGALSRLHPSLRGDSWLNKVFKQAVRLYSPGPPPPGLYMALLTYRLSDEEKGQFISKLKLKKSLAGVLRDSGSLKDRLKLLDDARLKPSRTYRLLHGYSTVAITANLLAGDSAVAKKQLKLFLDKLRYVKPELSGDDLKKMGITPGPRFKEILNRLKEARLDGEAASKEDEERLVRGWLASSPPA